jgi:hypothetical protein
MDLMFDASTCIWQRNEELGQLKLFKSKIERFVIS